MIVSVSGIGAWGNGFTNWQELTALLQGEDVSTTDQPSGPKPEVIPANERRRAPLMVRLAIEASWQAMQSSASDPSQVGCVFGSGLGDTDITDYMCRTLTTEHKQLSPTKFHNSVHNAAAGYWTISTDCMQSANSIAGFDLTASLALLESASQCLTEQRPILMTLFDAPVCDVLQPILINEDPFACALLIQPGQNAGQPALEIRIESNAEDSSPAWCNLGSGIAPMLGDLYQTNPSARILGVLDLLAKPLESSATVPMPLGAATALNVTRIA